MNVMSAEFERDSRHDDFEIIAHKLMRDARSMHSHGLFQYTEYLAHTTDCETPDAIRFWASKVLAGSDDQLQAKVFEYFNWEADRSPKVESAWLLTENAAADCHSGNGRYELGVQELCAAIDYTKKAIESSKYTMSNDYAQQLRRLFDTVLDDEALNSMYQQIGVIFSPYIVECRRDTMLNPAPPSDEDLDQLLVHASMALEEQYPESAQTARENILAARWKNAAESHATSLRLWYAYESQDQEAIASRIKAINDVIDDVFWGNMKNSYYCGQTDSNSIRGFIDFLGNQRPDYFTQFAGNRSNAEYGIDTSYIVAVSQRYDVVEQLLQQAGNENSIDIAWASEIARAYGEHDDYTGITKLMELVGADAVTKNILTQHFRIGTDRFQ